jgi:leader peptidase (prepilin peptidase)/N-methyltransferase
VPVFVDALTQAIVGAAVAGWIGYLSLWSVYWLFKLLTGKEGMGYGDFKLLAALRRLVWRPARRSCRSCLPTAALMSLGVSGAVVGLDRVAGWMCCRSSA